MEQYRGVRVGQIWEDTENDEPKFEIIAISENGEVTYRQYDQNETTAFADFIDWAETNCYAPTIFGEAFWIDFYNGENNG